MAAYSSNCHAERSGEESEAILTAQSKHPYNRPRPQVVGILTFAILPAQPKHP